MIRYTKNYNMGFEVPYRYGSEVRRYVPVQRVVWSAAVVYHHDEVPFSRASCRR